MARQMSCEQCGSTYDPSIFLPGQSFQCLECNTEMVVPASMAAPTPAPLPIDEPDTQVFCVPEALSQELPAVDRQVDSELLMEEEVTVTGYDLDAESEAIASASALLQRQEPDHPLPVDEPGPSAFAESSSPSSDVIVRGRETVDRAAFESGEQPTVRAAGFERTLTAQPRPDSPGDLSLSLDDYPHVAEPTNVASPGPEMLAILTPPERVHEHRDTEEAPSFDALESAAAAQYAATPEEQAHSMDALDAASDDWDVPTRSNDRLPGVDHQVDIYEEDTVSPSQAAEELQAAKESASKHTLHEEIAASGRTISAQSFHDLDGVDGVEEVLTPLPSEQRQGILELSSADQGAAGLWDEQTTDEPSPLEASPHGQGVAVQAHREQGPSAHINAALPDHAELAQIVEEAGGLMAPTIESSEAMGQDNSLDIAATQLEFPIPQGGFKDPNAAQRSNGSNGIHRTNGSHATGARPAALTGRSTDRDDDDLVLVPGGFWRRCIAWIIDVLLVYGLTGVGIWWSLRMWPPRTWLKGEIFLRLPPPFFQFLSILAASAACLFVLLMANLLYFGVGYKYKGTSLGKALFGLQVRHGHTREFIGFKQTFLREIVGKFLSVFLLCSGLLMVAFRKDKQSLHDLVFTTQVVRRPDASTRS